MNDDRTAQGLSEQDLLEFARQGHRDAFGRLIDAHLVRMWRVAWGVLRRDEAAAAVVRSSFLAAYRTLPAFIEDIPFPTWLARIVVTRALNALERTGEARPAPGADPGAPLALRAIDDGELPRRVQACRATIPGGLRVVLVLRDTERYSGEDIERILGLPGAAARARLARARMALWRGVTGVADSGASDKKLEELLSRFVDEDLDTGERDAAETAIAARPDVAALVEDLRRLRAAAAACDPPPPPSDLAERIRADLPEGETGPLRVPKSARARRGGAARRVPVLLTVSAVVGIGAVAVAVYVAVERGIAAAAWGKIRSQFASSAPTAEPPAAPLASPAARTARISPEVGEAATPPRTAPPENTSTPAISTGPAGQDTAAAPAPPGAATPRETPPAGAPAVPPAAGDETAAAETSAPRAATTEASSTSSAAPAAPTRSPAAEETAPGNTPSGPTACALTWTAPSKAPARWPGPAPPDSARRLGKLALALGGRGLLQPGDPPRVRITVRRERWSALLDALRREGVVAPDAGAPPATADCTALVVEATLPPVH